MRCKAGPSCHVRSVEVRRGRECAPPGTFVSSPGGALEVGRRVGLDVGTLVESEVGTLDGPDVGTPDVPDVGTPPETCAVG